MNYIKHVLENIQIISGIIAILYGVPYLIRLGWGHAENRTKKVCDICFRDIKKFNEKVKKQL